MLPITARTAPRCTFPVGSRGPGGYIPEYLPDLTAWLRAVAEDDVAYLVIEQGSTP